MKKIWIPALALAIVAFAVAVTRTSAATKVKTDKDVVSDVLATLASSDVNALPALNSPSFTLPKAGVDVMRVRMEEAYTIDGVGTDTVELRGWIATKHSNPYPVSGNTVVKWGTAQIDTEFVGLQLEGQSKIFGPVKVRLNSSERSIGSVGALPIPEIKGKEAMFLAKSNSSADPSSLATCAANINVEVSMPQIDMNMKTQQAVRMFSMVENIPPTGQTASISLTPTKLVSGDRVVGTLNRAEVKFREIVLRSDLKGDEPIR
ncbi:MAG: hypothetical protein J2P21_06295 [Chloracidobacterium sp.]|nr:hypothetical protein [Chloracidobacterium sp.]